MFTPPVICDNANHLLIPNSPLRHSRKSPTHRSLVTELIECACSTTLELSSRIPVSISTLAFVGKNYPNELFRKRASAVAAGEVVFWVSDMLLGLPLGEKWLLLLG